jgi:hypothetical protein
VSANGHEIAKIASLPVSAAFLVSNEHFSPCSVTVTPTAQSAAVGLYTLTHAFLI